MSELWKQDKTTYWIPENVKESLSWTLSECCSVTKSFPTLCDPVNCSMPGFPVLHYLLEFAQTHVPWVIMPSNHLVLCCPLLLLPSVFPRIRVFSNKLALWIRWPKYWSFSLSISPSNEYSGLISFRMGWCCNPRDSQRAVSSTTVQNH